MKLAALSAALSALVVAVVSSPAAAAPACNGAYADDYTALSAKARALDASAPAFSYAVRTTATYECLSYGGDQQVHREHPTATAYGTAFGYRREGGDTLLVTNEHVAAWPLVTDGEHAVDGVAPGCKRIADALAIVDNDHDDYAADDVPLERVVVDPVLDIAILRAHAKLPILPWKIGKSASLAPRDAVEVKGFPLGAFRATNLGKVVATHDHDEASDRDHDDFIVDAQLSHGNSGSPVLAISCATGELELVGVFHAFYAGGSSLNAVIAIDQVRDLMATLKPIVHAQVQVVLDGAARARVLGAARSPTDPAFFAFGALTASVAARPDGALVFSVFDPQFPRVSRPALTIEDRPATDATAFGALGAVWVSVPNAGGGLRLSALDTSDTATLATALAALREDAVRAVDERSQPVDPTASRVAFERTSAARRAYTRALAAQAPLATALLDLAGHAPVAPVAAPVAVAESPDLDAEP